MGGVNESPELSPEGAASGVAAAGSAAAGMDSAFLISISTTPVSDGSGVVVSGAGELQPGRQKASATNRQSGSEFKLLNIVFIECVRWVTEETN